MGRQKNVSKAILRAVYSEEEEKKSGLSRIIGFFNIINVTLALFHPDAFQKLRREAWQLDEKDYHDSFNSDDLQPVGDLGYSGSTFFTTQDSKYLIKSLPRRSEYHYFKTEMLEPYLHHMEQNPESLLVRITDFLYAPQRAIGTILRITPAHHIIMENTLFGKDRDEMGDQWETYDLKPGSYFYPERDLAGGHLASESVKERLLDTFEDKVRVTKAQMKTLLDQLEADCSLLEECNVVDYSLFLVRYPAENAQERDIPAADATYSSWRYGVKSIDGKWKYRAVVLDFFWAKHKLQAKAMTALIKSFNLFFRKGPMSITTNPAEYRKRFLGMAEELFEDPE